MSRTSCCRWDFSVNSQHIELEKLIEWCEENCKKWVFQLEVGEKKGYEHYQGRVSFKVKTKNPYGRICQECHWSVTSNMNTDNDFYVMKEETRVDGPWCDTDEKIYIPRQVREIGEDWYPWQKQVLEIAKEWDTRTIHVIVDVDGNKGKSIICQYMDVMGIGDMIPFVNDYKELMQWVMSFKKKGCYLIDMPKGMKKENLIGIYSAIETIKGGFAFDMRYKGKKEHFDCPNVIVFSNTVPNVNLLSRDR